VRSRPPRPVPTSPRRTPVPPRFSPAPRPPRKLELNSITAGGTSQPRKHRAAQLALRRSDQTPISATSLAAAAPSRRPDRIPIRRRDNQYHGLNHDRDARSLVTPTDGRRGSPFLITVSTRCCKARIGAPVGVDRQVVTVGRAAGEEQEAEAAGVGDPLLRQLGYGARSHRGVAV